MTADRSPSKSGFEGTREVKLAAEPDFSLGRTRVRPSLREITIDGVTETLEPRVMEVLVALVRARGAVASREELIESCWHGRSVSEDAIERCVARLRRLSEGKSRGSFRIETIPRVGYRLVTDAEPGCALPDTAAETRSSVVRRRGWVAGALALVALVVTIGLSIVQSHRSEQWTVADSKLLNLPAPIGRWPAISPDGKAVAYSAGNDLYSRKIYLDDGGVAPPRRLTSDMYDDVSPAWSSDAKSIVYAAFKIGEPCRLMMISVRGGQPREIGRCLLLDRTAVRFGASDRSVLFVDKVEQGAPQQIFELDVTTGARAAVSHPPKGTRGDTAFSVSPDARTLAFLRSSDRGYDVTVQDPRRANARVIWRDNSPSLGLAWSDDSTALFVATNHGGDHALWTLPLDGGTPRRFTSGALYFGRLSSGPGGLLAAEVSTHQQELTQTASTSGAGPVPVYPSLAQSFSPTFSPDGTLAFVSNRSGGNGIWVVKDGSLREIARFGQRFIYHLCWSPDGARLAFEMRDGDGGLSVQIISENGAAIARVRAPGLQLDAPSWSADGNAIVIAAEDGKGWRIWHADTNGQRGFQPLSEYGWRNPHIHDQALYAMRADAPGVWYLGDHRPARLVLAGVRQGSPWMFSGQSIVAVDSPGAEHPKFIRWPLDGSPPVTAAAADGYYSDLTGEYNGGFSVNPRSGRIVYVGGHVAGQNADADIMVMRVTR